MNQPACSKVWIPAFSGMTVLVLFFAISMIVTLAGCATPKRHNPQASPSTPMLATPDNSVQTIRVIVTHGYQPEHIIAEAGKPMIIEFIRKEETGSCARELEIPRLNIKRILPNYQSVKVNIPAQEPGLIPFQCGMNMMQGVIEVR